MDNGKKVKVLNFDDNKNSFNPDSFKNLCNEYAVMSAHLWIDVIKNDRARDVDRLAASKLLVEYSDVKTETNPFSINNNGRLKIEIKGKSSDKKRS